MLISVIDSVLILPFEFHQHITSVDQYLTQIAARTDPHCAVADNLGPQPHPNRCRQAIDDIEDFRGIPYAHVPGRWEHARMRHLLPRDTFDVTENG